MVRRERGNGEAATFGGGGAAMNDGMLSDVARAMAKGAIPAGLLAQAAEQGEGPAEPDPAGETSFIAPVRTLPLRVACIAVVTAILAPAVAWVLIAGADDPARGVAIGMLVTMAIAFVTGIIASIAAVVQKERWGWVTLAASLLVPYVWLGVFVSLHPGLNK